MRELTPRETVAELDRFIVGQDEAKRAVAIAVRNRWRRRQLPEEMQAEVSPKNILMIGPTGVGKTEIARRLATLTGAPFIKVEATKYTEVGYYGRDVESMIRELVENAVSLVNEAERNRVKDEADLRVRDRLLDMLAPRPSGGYEFAVEVDQEANDAPEESDGRDRYQRLRDKMAALLDAGKLEERHVELVVEAKAMPMMVAGPGMEHFDLDLQQMLEKMLPKQRQQRELTVAEARKVLFEQECDGLISQEKVNAAAVELAENLGVVFVDEVDKIVATEGGKGADVSRQGVQRDLLPIVEGATVQTKYGHVRTDHILFIAAGAFHRAKPSDLMPELQGRFPIRVELTDLTKDDFVRILTEPRGALTKQYTALLGVEGVQIEFAPEAIELLAGMAFDVNRRTQNIGARRLNTIMERLFEDLSFAAPDDGRKSVRVDAEFVRATLSDIAQDEDLSRLIL